MSEENILDKIPANYTGGVLTKAKRNARHYRISCCVPGCPSKDNVKGISFHRLPKTKKINKLWKIKLRLVDKIPSTYSVCSKHFVTSDYFAGEYRHIMRNKMLLKSAVPSQNLPAASHSRRKNTAQNEKRAQRLLNRSTQHSTDNSSSNGVMSSNGVIVKKPKESKKQANANQKTQNSTIVKSERTTSLDISIQKSIDETKVKINATESETDALPPVNVMDLLKTRNKLNAWTGIPTFFLLRKIEERVSAIHIKRTDGNDLSPLDCIVLCFIRLKTKLPFICLSSIFNISTSMVSKIFNSMLPIIKEALDDVDYFSSTIENQDNQLILLRMYGYNEVRAIFDCSDGGDLQNSKCSCTNNVDPLSLDQNTFHETKPMLTDLCSPKLERKSAAESGQ